MAYGDVVAATLALLSLLSLRRGTGVVIAWIFNLWGTVDLLNAFYEANHAGLLPGQLGSSYFISTFVVPLLLITHGIALRVLLQHQNRSTAREAMAVQAIVAKRHQAVFDASCKPDRMGQQ